jgi:hypothetical protein
MAAHVHCSSYVAELPRDVRDGQRISGIGHIHPLSVGKEQLRR